MFKSRLFSRGIDLTKCSLNKVLKVASLFKEGFKSFGMSWLGMSCKDLLADVNDSKEVPTVISVPSIRIYKSQRHLLKALVSDLPLLFIILVPYESPFS